MREGTNADPKRAQSAGKGSKMAKNKFEYTKEILADLVERYAEKRNAGELNKDILAELVKDYEGLNVRSLRAKLMVEKVYIKDTDAEKAKVAEAREAEKGNKEKGEKVTKKMVAVAILNDLGADVALAEDLAKAKADTLAVIFNAVRELVKAEDAEETAEAVEA